MRVQWAVLLAVVALLPSCSSLNFIKRRLPPPSQGASGVTFKFSAPSAKVVQLAGSWPENNWLRGQAQTGGFRVGEMHDADGDGVWERTEKLPPGRWEYKFVVDGTNWKEDPNNPEYTDDGFGGKNSVITVQ